MSHKSGRRERPKNYWAGVCVLPGNCWAVAQPFLDKYTRLHEALYRSATLACMGFLDNFKRAAGIGSVAHFLWTLLPAAWQLAAVAGQRLLAGGGDHIDDKNTFIIPAFGGLVPINLGTILGVPLRQGNPSGIVELELDYGGVDGDPVFHLQYKAVINVMIVTPIGTKQKQAQRAEEKAPAKLGFPSVYGAGSSAYAGPEPRQVRSSTYS
jgi:hypothetical protein